MSQSLNLATFGAPIGVIDITGRGHAPSTGSARPGTYVAHQHGSEEFGGLTVNRPWDVDTAREFAMDQMGEHGLLKDGWRFEFNNEKSRIGWCMKSTKTISVSSHYTRFASEDEFRNTVLHEIAHAITPTTFTVGPSGRRRRVIHGPEWKANARRIGCTGDRCGVNPYAEDQERKLNATKPENAGAVRGEDAFRKLYEGKYLPLARSGDEIITRTGEVGVIVESRRTKYVYAIPGGTKYLIPFESVSFTENGRGANKPIPEKPPVAVGDAQVATGEPIEVPRGVRIKPGNPAVIWAPGTKYHLAVGTVEKVNPANYKVMLPGFGRLNVPHKMARLPAPTAK